jgi:hypothetical protein
MESAALDRGYMAELKLFVCYSVIENDQDNKQETILQRKTEEEHQKP